MQTDLIGARVEIGSWRDGVGPRRDWVKARDATVRGVAFADDAFVILVEDHDEVGGLYWLPANEVRVVHDHPIPFLGRPDPLDGKEVRSA